MLSYLAFSLVFHILFVFNSAMLLPILAFPDPRLNIVAKPVAEVDKRISALIADMLETMYDAKGIGLAATQVNVHERLVVIDVSDERDQPLVLINPEITWYSPEKHVGEEGCLSVPEIYDKVERAVAVKVSYLDAKGKPQTLEADDMLAVCIQHELDHLLGKVFVEYLSKLKFNRIKTKMLKIKREDEKDAQYDKQIRPKL
jgi:peptide deformylase